jgi:hypothetical protein
MRTRSEWRIRTWAALAGLLFAVATAVVPMALAAAVSAASVDASIEPSQIALGESAQLTISISGSGTLSVPLPVVSGLEFRVVAQSRRIEIINGTSISSTSTIIRVTPEEAGVFTIPGPTPKSPPLLLKVTPSGGAGPSLPPNNSTVPGLNSLLHGGSEANGIRLTPDGSAFVRLEVPKHELYVGESIPAEIQVGLRNGFAASNNLPKLNSGDFTLNNLSFQPERTARVIDGKPFTVFTWHSLLAPIKPGTYSLTFSIPATVRIRTQPRSDSMIDDLLGDPFMQNIFGASITRSITVSSPEAAFTVLPLPTEGRPAEFGGAVGSFKISTDISSATNTAGDPLTLRLHVNGAGTFDRVESNMLAGDGRWKTYQPKAAFHQTDAAGYRGEKVFEQPLIASQPGVNTIPPLTFSFFDPGTRRFETVHSAPLTVTVFPSAADSTAAPALANASGANGDDSHGLRPDHAQIGARVDSLIPLYFQPRFFAIPPVLALLFGGAWVALRRREHDASDIQRARDRVRSQMAHAALTQMAAAAAGADPASFFNAARAALRQSLSAQWQIAPAHIGWAEVDARIERGDREDILQIFALADEANYSGGGLQAADFARWTQLVRRQMVQEMPP